MTIQDIRTEASSFHKPVHPAHSRILKGDVRGRVVVEI